MPVKQATKPDLEADAPPPRDHNRPPPEEIIPEEFREGLIEQKPEFFTLLDRYLGPIDPETGDRGEGAVDRAKCDDEHSYKLCGEIIKALRAATQLVDHVHKGVKQPYLDAGRLCDAQKNAFYARINEGRDAVQRMMDNFTEAQRQARIAEERKQREERERLEALARENNLEQALPPPAPVRKPEPIRSDGGATISGTVEYDVEIVDFAKAARKFKDDAKVREAILAAAKKVAKATRGAEIPGIKITERAVARVR